MKTDTILEKLNNLQQLIKLESAPLKQDERPLTFAEACIYLGVSRSHLYKLTCRQKISHFKPNNKKLYFLKSDLNNYMLRNRRKSEEEIDQKASDYIQERSN
jgi:excisionase family DNA binding protein